MSKVLLVINHSDRDGPALQVIEQRLHDADPNIQTLRLEWRAPDFFEQAYTFCPDLVLSFPFTAHTCCRPVLALKIFCGSRVVCYRTEGGMIERSPESDQSFIGYDDYPAELVDLEIFWGWRMDDVVGNALIKSKRLKSMLNCKVAGYVEYEKYFKGLSTQWVKDNPAAILFVTGFHAADYSHQDIVNARDWYDPACADPNAELIKALERAALASSFRQLWIKHILQSAKDNPDVYHIIKPHPIEQIIFERKKINPYSAFNGIANIQYSTDSLAAYLPCCGLFLHYGSTAIAASILAEVPSVFVMSETVYPDRLKSEYVELSDMSVDITKLSNLVRLYADNGFVHTLTDAKREMLFEVFNISAEQLETRKGYAPSADIARMIFEVLEKPAQPV